ncbi:hypothetical protein ATI61_103146 [Archangium gephyra]|uniref:Lipoprotein n=1 Tax=Archangium gephyra TaxID=48 RepID=A0ABX9K6E8_9BACT|nr:hypothetical protein [Archangium gephyra]REG34253.1 hypothetical protein ATI61_103146 [Archangium gephyra]
MNRRTLGLLAALSLTSACKEEPVGEMTPIPRPADMPATPAKKAEAPKPVAAEPPPDPSKVVLRWKLDAPTAFRLTTTSSGSGAPAEAPKGKKGKKDKEPQPAAGPGETAAIFVLQRTESGDYAFRIVPEGAGVEADQGTMSERGFVMDGLAGPLRNTAVLVLELPRDPVGPEATWALGADLVDMGAVPGFVEKKAERRNQVKLTALTPGENGEQVATLEYDLTESLSGEVRATRARMQAAAAKAAAAKPGHSHDDGHGHEDESTKGEPSVLAEMRVKGRGEFLVKAGRWRSWEATLTTRTEGTTLPGTAEGERTLRLTPLDSVPPELLQPQAKK